MTIIEHRTPSILLLTVFAAALTFVGCSKPPQVESYESPQVPQYTAKGCWFFESSKSPSDLVLTCTTSSVIGALDQQLFIENADFSKLKPAQVAAIERFKSEQSHDQRVHNVKEAARSLHFYLELLERRMSDRPFSFYGPIYESGISSNANRINEVINSFVKLFPCNLLMESLSCNMDQIQRLGYAEEFQSIRKRMLDVFSGPEQEPAAFEEYFKSCESCDFKKFSEYTKALNKLTDSSKRQSN